MRSDKALQRWFGTALIAQDWYPAPAQLRVGVRQGDRSAYYSSSRAVAGEHAFAWRKGAGHHPIDLFAIGLQ